MKIALDYDETFTRDKSMWSMFASMAVAMGHEVAFVTFRHEGRGGGNEDIIADAAQLGLPVVFCNAKQKAHCYQADIWIDDMPHLIPSYDVLRQMALGCEVMGDKQ